MNAETAATRRSEMPLVHEQVAKWIRQIDDGLTQLREDPDIQKVPSSPQREDITTQRTEFYRGRGKDRKLIAVHEQYSDYDPNIWVQDISERIDLFGEHTYRNYPEKSHRKTSTSATVLKGPHWNTLYLTDGPGPAKFMSTTFAWSHSFDRFGPLSIDYPQSIMASVLPSKPVEVQNAQPQAPQKDVQ